MNKSITKFSKKKNSQLAYFYLIQFKKTKRKERPKWIFLSLNSGSIIYGTDESELILQPHFHFRY
ncbi:hypothetical protein EGK24_13455 [Enterococcus faecium]|nr:hypothetical protein EGK24_13455 [Enterococcus faecium]